MGWGVQAFPKWRALHSFSSRLPNFPSGQPNLPPASIPSASSACPAVFLGGGSLGRRPRARARPGGCQAANGLLKLGEPGARGKEAGTRRRGGGGGGVASARRAWPRRVGGSPAPSVELSRKPRRSPKTRSAPAQLGAPHFAASPAAARPGPEHSRFARTQSRTHARTRTHVRTFARAFARAPSSLALLGLLHFSALRGRRSSSSSSSGSWSSGRAVHCGGARSSRRVAASGKRNRGRDRERTPPPPPPPPEGRSRPGVFLRPAHPFARAGPAPSTM